MNTRKNDHPMSRTSTRRGRIVCAVSCALMTLAPAVAFAQDDSGLNDISRVPSAGTILFAIFLLFTVGRWLGRVILEQIN